MKTIPAATLDALRRYAAPFADVLPPALAAFAGRDPVFPYAPGSPRGLAVLLLAAALHWPDGEEAAVRALAWLHARFGEDLFRLNRVPFEALAEAVLASGAYPDEGERKRVPGILRSACDFLDAKGPLDAWLASADREARVRELAGAVYWMGKSSLLKNKARYFFWLVARAAELKGGTLPPAGLAPDPKAPAFAWPVTEGHGRFYQDFLRAPLSAGLDPARRLALFADLARKAFDARGEAGWRLYPALEAYLRRGGPLVFRCREAQGGCRPCPLNARCPAAKHFLPAEK